MGREAGEKGVGKALEWWDTGGGGIEVDDRDESVWWVGRNWSIGGGMGVE